EAVQLWDTTTGQLLRELIAEETNLASVAFSADGKHLAGIDQGDHVTLWEVDSGKHLRRWKAQAGDNNIVVLGSGIAKPLAFAPDGKTVATIGLRVNNVQEVVLYLWETATGKLQRSITIDNQDRDFFRILFAPDGKTVATAGQGGNVALWATA